MADGTRVQIRGRGWTKPVTIDAEKYAVMSRAILASLTSEPVTFTKLVEEVSRRLPEFDGSVSWYAITCARELEVQGKLVRQERPVRYLKAAAAGRGRQISRRISGNSSA